MSLSIRSLFTALILCTPGLAYAHTPIEGIGNFYNGLLHPVWVAAHLLAIIAFGLLIGQQGIKAIRPTLPAFLLALLAGLCVVAFDITFDAELTLLIVTAILGLLVALERRLPLAANLLLAVALGGIVGLDSPQEDLWGMDKFYALSGTWLGVCLCLSLMVGFAAFLLKPWQRILIRVLGSWTTASAFLVLATLFVAANKPPPPPDNDASSDTYTFIIKEKK